MAVLVTNLVKVCKSPTEDSLVDISTVAVDLIILCQELWKAETGCVCLNSPLSLSTLSKAPSSPSTSVKDCGSPLLDGSEQQARSLPTKAKAALKVMRESRTAFQSLLRSVTCSCPLSRPTRTNVGVGCEGPSTRTWSTAQGRCYSKIHHHGPRNNSSNEASAQVVTTTGFGISSSVVHWYSKMLDTHPLLTKAITSGFIAGSGDWICQSLQHQQKGTKYLAEEGQSTTTSKPPNSSWWDVTRTGRFVVLGALLVAPAVHVWYGQLARWIPGTNPSAVMRRVAMDQLIFAPVFMTIWLSSLKALEFQQTLSVQQLLTSENLSGIVVANWVLWVPAQVVNFRCVPLKFQVLYSNVVALLWNVYLSYETSSTAT